MKQASRCPVVLLSLIGSALAFGCGGHPASPSAVAAGTVPSAGTTTPAGISSIKLVSGWDNGSVDDAQVSVAGKTYHPDHNGVVRFDGDVSGDGVAMDVTAPGFLFRQTFVTSAPQVTLWPANPAEVDAIKAMAYTPSGEMFGKFYESDYLGTEDYAIGGDFARSPEGATLLDNLRSSGDRLRLVLQADGHNLFRLEPGTPLTSVDMTLDLVDDTQCSDAWGFCGSATSRPFVVHVSRVAAGRQDVALRLLAQLFLQGNPLSGLMNRTHPASDLSLLEQQTLRMMFQRGYVNRWQDNDRQ